jgi:Fe-S-cluster-containing dehydrogenase component
MAGNQQLPVVTIPDELTTQDEVRNFIHQTISRRSFVGVMGVAGLGAVAFQFGCSGGSKGVTPRQVFVANSLGMVVNDPALCVGCRRCESACVAYNQGKAQPHISNVKVNRNLLFGELTPTLDSRGDGLYGDFRLVGNTCMQCPHPVPCQLSCPHAAIEVIPPVNARVVNDDKCVGCGICVEACPWEMPTLDGTVMGAATKSNKCHLCAGAPECVAACTSGALQYVAWEDRTKTVPERQVVPASIQLADDVKDTCKQCH